MSLARVRLLSSPSLRSRVWCLPSSSYKLVTVHFMIGKTVGFMSTIATTKASDQNATDTSPERILLVIPLHHEYESTPAESAQRCRSSKPCQYDAHGLGKQWTRYEPRSFTAPRPRATLRIHQC